MYEPDHRATSKECPLNNENWTYKHWYEWQYHLYKTYGVINNLLIMKPLQNYIQQISKNKFNKMTNGMIIFNAVNKSIITMVSQFIIYYLIDIYKTQLLNIIQLII